ncbi:hypothetical protein [Enterococcus sp. AZ029]|uniref:hypothetical protein n=1 Tax=Enterococcus sp. AZ029 TaxID=2774841 RepID=UPI003F24045C
MDITLALLPVVIPVVLTVLLAEFQRKKGNKEKTFSTTYAPYLQQHLFKKYLYSIEHQLFVKITHKNHLSIRLFLFKLFKDIENDKTLFTYLDNNFISSLFDFIQTKPTSNHYQTSYNKFSANYLYLLNKTRKSLSLEPRKDSYIKTFHLYTERYYFCYLLIKYIKDTSNFLLTTLFLCFFITILIAALINFITASITVIEELTKIL